MERATICADRLNRFNQIMAFCQTPQLLRDIADHMGVTAREVGNDMTTLKKKKMLGHFGYGLSSNGQKIKLWQAMAKEYVDSSLPTPPPKPTLPPNARFIPEIMVPSTRPKSPRVHIGSNLA